MSRIIDILCATKGWSSTEKRSDSKCCSVMFRFLSLRETGQSQPWANLTQGAVVSDGFEVAGDINDTFSVYDYIVNDTAKNNGERGVYAGSKYVAFGYSD